MSNLSNTTQLVGSEAKGWVGFPTALHCLLNLVDLFLQSQLMLLRLAHHKTYPDTHRTFEKQTKMKGDILPIVPFDPNGGLSCLLGQPFMC